MPDSTNISSEHLKRVPGLFRRWELAEVLEAERRYHIEDAGTHSDGTPLLAVYANEAVHHDDLDYGGGALLPRAPVTEQFISQRDLADRWDISPRTLERWRRLKRGPTYLKLGFRIVYSLQHVRAFEAEHLHVLRAAPPSSHEEAQR